MRSRESALRSKRFEVQEKTRKVQGLEHMLREFEQIASDLERQVQSEEDRTGVKDRHHFAYSTYAKAATQRRDKLMASIDDLKLKLDDAVRERDEAQAEAQAGVMAEANEIDRDRSRRRHERHSVASLR